MLTSLIVGALISGAAPAERHAARADCRGDRRIECWEAERRPRVRELFGTKAVEEFERTGDQLRRAYYVDGYDRDVVAIEFVRPRGADPSLTVRFPKSASNPRQPLTAPVPLADWQDVLETSAHFDRALVKTSKKSKPGEIVICVHAWVYTVEAVDPPEQEMPAQVRRRSQNACDEGLVQAYAIDLSKLAARLIPPCDVLNRSDYRNEADLLSSCGMLAGDRMSAAVVLNAARPLRNIWDEADFPRLSGLFDYRTKINWAGQAYSGNEAAQFWARKASEGARTPTHLSIRQVIGESATRVRLRGRLSRYVENGAYEEADVEQLWELDSAESQIRQATVGPFKPIKR